MKSIIDKQYKPDNNWKQWEHNGFHFVDHNDPWEHPQVSPLGYTNKVNYGQLDSDSDWQLESWAKSYWIPDILQRQEELPEKLVEVATIVQELDYIYYNIINEDLTLDIIPDDFYEWLKTSKYADIKDLKTEAPEYDFLPESLQEKESYLVRAIVDYRIKVLRNKLYKEYNNLIFSIIKNNYSPFIDTVKQAIYEKFIKNHVRSEAEHFPSIFERKTQEERAQLVQEKEQQARNTFSIEYAWHNEIKYGNSYGLNIILYPAENLFSYFHDEMLFMNFIQEMVYHTNNHIYNDNLDYWDELSDEDKALTESDLVINKVLLDDDLSIDDKLLKQIIYKTRTWWT